MLQKKIVSLFVVMTMLVVPLSVMLNSVDVLARKTDEDAPMTVIQFYGWMNRTDLGNGSANSQVYFEDLDGQGASNSTITNATGYYSMNVNVTGGGHRFNVYGINNTALLNKTEQSFNEFAGPLQRWDIDLDPAPPRDSSVRGYVTDAVSGLAIQFETLTALSETETYMNYSMTNITGFYNMSLIPEKYNMGLDTAGYENQTIRFRLASGDDIWRNITLEPLNSQLRGWVNDSGGSPIIGAKVYVEESWNVEPWNDDYVNYTNVTGYYEFNITRGTKAVMFTAGGYLMSSRPAGMASGKVTWLNVTLVSSPADQATLKGYIKDFGTSNNISNSVVYISNMNRTWSNSTTSDGTGYYEMQAPAWNLTVTARNWEHFENGTEVSGLAGQTTWANITLTNRSDSATIRGNVTLDGATPSWADIQAVYWNNQWGQGINGTGGYILNVQAGYVRLKGLSRNSNIESLNVVLMPGEVFWYDFDLYTLAFDSILLGKMTDQSAVPVEDGLMFISNGADNFDTYSSGLLSDFNGTYEIMVPRGEPLNYIIWSQGFKMETGSAVIDQEWNWNNLTLTPMPDEVTVRGYLRNLTMAPVRGHELMASIGEDRNNLDYMNWTTTNLTGYYEIRLPKGEVMLSAEMRNSAYYDPGTLYLDTKDGQDVWLNISVRPRPRSFVVRGHVWQQDDTPIAGVKVTGAVGSVEVVDFTDAGGNYSFKISSGSVELTARKNGYGSAQPDNFYINEYQPNIIEWRNLTLANYPADAWLEKPFTETLEDIDGDGKNDTLHIDVLVNVTNSQKLSIVGTLKSSKWENSQSGMGGSMRAVARNETVLSTGLTQVRLSFYGPMIYQLKEEYNYVEIELKDNNWNDLDILGNRTARYSWKDFDKPDAEVADPPHSYSAVDTDFDGLYNLLLFNTSVNVLAPGNYSFLAQLYNVPSANNNNNMTYLDMTIVTKEMQPGINTVNFSFTGSRIFNTGAHLGLATVTIYNGTISMNNAPIIGSSQVYVPYNYTEFQSYPTDSLVYGWVNESDGTTPILNATVEIYNVTARYLNETLTNSTGYYELGGWEGSWLLVANDGANTNGKYQGNLTTISLNSTTPVMENRNLSDPVLDSQILTIVFDDWDNATVDVLMDVYIDNETQRYEMDVRDFGNGDGFLSESEADMMMGFLGSQVQMPGNLSDYMTVNGTTYDLDPGSATMDLGLTGSITSKEPVYIHQRGNYTANTSIPAAASYNLSFNASYDDTAMGSMSDGNSTETTYIIPPAGWGRTGNKTTISCNFTGSDFITIDPGTDPDPSDSNITEWVNITISDSQTPTIGAVAGNITLDGRSTHYGAVVTARNATTGVEVGSAPTDIYGYYYIPGLPPDTYNITAAKGGYQANYSNNTNVIAGETTWVVNMTLYSFPPVISNVQYLAVVVNDSAQTIFADVTDEGTVGDVTLSYKNVTGSNLMIPMTLLGGSTYSAVIPAQQNTGYVEFNITANDTVGNSATDPIAGNYNITIIETVPPVLTNLQVVFDPTEFSNPTNVSVNVTDYSPISGVWLNLTNPLAGNTNDSMTFDPISGKYYREGTYLILGLYTFTIWTNDSFDNWNFAAGSFWVNDTTLPVISNVTVTPDPTEFGDWTNISANMTDLAGITGAWLNVTYFNGTVFSNNSMQNATGNLMYENFTCPTAGQYNFTIWVEDGNGVWNYTSGVFWVNDTTLPAISNVTVQPDPTELGQATNISANFTDLAGIAGAWLNVTYFNGTVFSNNSMQNGTGNLMYENFTSPSAGQYNFTIWTQDGNGVWNYTTGDFWVNDTTPPAITDVTVQPDPTELGQATNISANFTDLAGIGGAWLEVRFSNGTVFTNNSMIQGTANLRYSPVLCPTAGNYNFTIWAQDGNGVWNFAAGSFWVIDTTLPSISNVIVQSDPTELGQSTNISANFTDLGGIAGAWLNVTYFNGTVFFNNSMQTGIGNLMYENFTSPTAGQYNFTIWTQDGNGLSNSNSGVFRVNDTTLPAISNVTVQPDPTELGQATNISANFTDLAGIAEAWLNVTYFNGTPFINNSMQSDAGNLMYENFTCPTAGQYNFTIWAQDGNGLWNFAAGSFRVNDTTPPAISNVTALPVTVELGGSVNITADANDLSGISNVSLQIFGPDGGEIKNETMNAGSYWYEFTPSGLGTFNYTIWVVDGNDVTNSISSNFTVEDTTAPTFTSVSIQPSSQEVFGYVNITVDIYDMDYVSLCYFNLTDPDGGWISNNTITFAGGIWFVNQTYDLLGDYSYTLWALDPSGNGKRSTGTITTVDSTGPVAVAGIDRTIDAGDTVTFNASLSTDNYDIDNYTWVFTDNGVQTLFGAVATYTFSNVGTYSVVLTVRDYAGLTSTNEIVITVLDAVTTGTVTGTVLDESGSPVEGVTVYIEGYPGIETVTNAAGLYVLDNVPEGQQVLVFYKDGYVRSSTTIDVVAGETTTVGDEELTATSVSTGFPLWLLLLLPALVIAVLFAAVLMKKKGKEEPIIDEIFFMSSTGLLIKHFTRRLKPDMDQDILSGMLVAVQDFVKDSFRGETGGLEEMKFGQFQIIIAHGKFSIIAALILGDEPEKFKPQVHKCISDIEKDFGDVLEDWDGDIDTLVGSFKYIDNLIDGKYRHIKTHGKTQRVREIPEREDVPKPPPLDDEVEVPELPPPEDG